MITITRFQYQEEGPSLSLSRVSNQLWSPMTENSRQILLLSLLPLAEVLDDLPAADRRILHLNLLLLHLRRPHLLLCRPHLLLRRLHLLRRLLIFRRRRIILPLIESAMVLRAVLLDLRVAFWRTRLLVLLTLLLLPDAGEDRAGIRQLALTALPSPFLLHFNALFHLLFLLPIKQVR